MTLTDGLDVVALLSRPGPALRGAVPSLCRAAAAITRAARLRRLRLGPLRLLGQGGLLRPPGVVWLMGLPRLLGLLGRRRFLGRLMLVRPLRRRHR